jgi:hypothetical protein
MYEERNKNYKSSPKFTRNGETFVDTREVLTKYGFFDKREQAGKICFSLIYDDVQKIEILVKTMNELLAK